MKQLSQTVKTAIFDATQYSLALRIAARMHIEGITEAEATKLLNPRNPLHLEIINNLRDIERGWTDLNPRLQRLAETL